jgi:hypothetical protein
VCWVCLFGVFCCGWTWRLCVASVVLYHPSKHQ